MKSRQTFMMLLRGAQKFVSSAPSCSRASSITTSLNCIVLRHQHLSCPAWFRSHAIISSEGRRSLAIAASATSSSDAASSTHITLETIEKEPFPEALIDCWYQLMRVLHQQGHFTHTAAAREIAIQNRNDVKTALLTFARSRGDIIFGLSVADLTALAEVPMVPGERGVERKLANAAARLHSTFIKNEHGPNGQNHASTQDLMRVLWEWACMPDTQLESQAPGLGRVVRSLVQQVAKSALSDPVQEHVLQAQKLGTPTVDELAAQNKGRAETRAAAKAELDPQTARVHAGRLSKASSTTVLEAGDWFCAVCGTTNFRGRKTCIRCRLPARSLGNTVVSPEDIFGLYGARPPRRVLSTTERDPGAARQAAAGQPPAAGPSSRGGDRVRDGERRQGVREGGRRWEEDAVEEGGRASRDGSDRGMRRGYEDRPPRRDREDRGAGSSREWYDGGDSSEARGRQVSGPARDRGERVRYTEGREERRWGRENDGSREARGRPMYDRQERDDRGDGGPERGPRRWRSEEGGRDAAGRFEGREDEDGLPAALKRDGRARREWMKQGGRGISQGEREVQGGEEFTQGRRPRREDGAQGGRGSYNGGYSGRGDERGSRREFTLQELLEKQGGARLDKADGSKPSPSAPPASAPAAQEGGGGPAGARSGAAGWGRRGGRRSEEAAVELMGDDVDYFR